MLLLPLLLYCSLQPIVTIFRKLLASDFSFISLNAMTALEHFSSTAPGNHVQWILVQCIPSDKQNHFRKRLQRQMHYFTDEQNKHFRGMVSIILCYYFIAPLLYSLTRPIVLFEYVPLCTAECNEGPFRNTSCRDTGSSAKRIGAADLSTPY